MSYCWLWLFCTYLSFLVDGQLGCWPRRVFPSGLQRTGRRAELLGVKLGFPRSRCRAVVSDVLCVRSYVHFVCVCVYICVYVCTCADMYIYIYICACVYVYVYVCVYTHVYVYVYAYLCIDCESRYQCISLWTVEWMRMCARVYMYVYAYGCGYIYMCIFLQ